MPYSTRFAAAGALLLTTISLGVSAVPAQAAATGVVSVVSVTKVEYKAASGKQNSVVVTRAGNTITVDDKVAVKAGKGCKAIRGDKTKVKCTTTRKPTRLRVFTYDRNDSVVNKTDLGMTADGGTGNDKLYGGPANDDLQGGSGNDKLFGLGGADSLYGSDGNDRFSGGDGDDILDGSHGNDVMYGGNGNDLMFGMNGNDRMYGGAGDDRFDMSEATAPGDADYISGGSGARDAISYITYDKAITADADGVTGDDGARGEHDTIAADVEEIQGGGGNDRLYGTGRADYLYGWKGNDIIRGGAGDDVVAGEGGRDSLYGEAGDDVVVGSDWDGPQAADRLDGGPNRTAAGDFCEAYRRDVKIGCER